MNSSTNDGRWEDVVNHFRAYCLAKRANRPEEAERLFKHELSPCIAEWSRRAPGDAETKRTRLNAMFAAEQKRIQDAWELKDFITRSLRTELVPALRDEIRAMISAESAPAPRASQAKRAVPAPRIRFDDIPAALDRVLAEQSRSSFQPAVHP